MTMSTRAVIARVTSFFRQLDDELDEEVRTHLELLVPITSVAA
jgi:hypothetical protein